MKGRTRKPRQTRSLLEARVAELEQRIKLLEAKVRLLNAEARAQAIDHKKKVPAPKGRARPRCPGCLLELPPGRRGESCVWCGFYFSAVKGKAWKS